MIKFFRHLRQQFLFKNRLSRYFVYAIGEIVLVVIGILIALSINTWNEGRKQHSVEKEIVNGIKNDLTRDIDYINTIIALAEEKISVYNLLDKEIYTYYTNDRNGLDSLLRKYFDAQRTFYPISGTYQSAISGNEISKFKDKDFSSSVTELYNSTYARLIDNSKIVDDKWHYLTKKYSQIRRTGQIPDMDQPQLTEFLNDVSYHIYSMNYYREILYDTLKKIDQILLNH